MTRWKLGICYGMFGMMRSKYRDFIDRMISKGVLQNASRVIVRKNGEVIDRGSSC
jgi:hypothetical protein